MEKQIQEKMLRQISRVLTALMLGFFLATSVPVQAQTPDDPSVDDPAVPVDGGLSLLLAAGAAYGVRGVRRKQKA